MACGAAGFWYSLPPPRAALSQWVSQEWTALLADHGPRQRIIVVMFESVQLPTLLKTVQQIDATRRSVAEVAGEIVRIVGRVDHLREEDSRGLTLGQDLVFMLARTADGHLDVTDPVGTTRRLTPPWLAGTDYAVAAMAFRQLTREPVTTDGQRVEIHQHASMLGRLLFDVLFGVESSRSLLVTGQGVGRPRPLRNDDDVLLSLPWELLHEEPAIAALHLHTVIRTREDMARGRTLRAATVGVAEHVTRRCSSLSRPATSSSIACASTSPIACCQRTHITTKGRGRWAVT